MTFTELSSAIETSLQTGNIGTPVALRMQVRLSNESAAPALLDESLAVARNVFGADPSSVTANGNPPGHFSSLFTYDTGQTTFITLDAESSYEPALHLLLIGNRGVIRLEGAECFAPDVSTASSAWLSLVTTSVAHRQAIRVDTRPNDAAQSEPQI